MAQPREPDEPSEPRPRAGRIRRFGLRAGLVIVVVFAALQLVPYGWGHPNPPVVADAPWPDAESEALARTSCYACHSNETDWPPYSFVAPMSWLVRNDVEEGRAKLNFSEWDDGDADDAAEEVADDDMPLPRYALLHPDAELSDDERRQLLDALGAMGEGDGD